MHFVYIFSGKSLFLISPASRRFPRHSVWKNNKINTIFYEFVPFIFIFPYTQSLKKPIIKNVCEAEFLKYYIAGFIVGRNIHLSL